MKKILQNTALGLLLPYLLCLMTYSQNQGYFASNYTLLAQAFFALLVLHLVVSALGLSFRLTGALYIALMIPLGACSLLVDTILRFIIIGLVYLILKKIPVKPLCIGLALLLVFNSYKLFQADHKARKEARQLLSQAVPSIATPHSENIYWIICDAYTSKEALNTYYQLDNSSFYQGLESLGFSTPDGRVPHYPTLKAINTYVQPLEWDPNAYTSLCLHYTLQSAPLFKSLTQEGYTLHILEPRFPFLQNLSQFEPLEPVPQTSLLEFLYACTYRTKLAANALISTLNQRLFQRQESIWQRLCHLEAKTGKQFYYIHLDLPHAPFILNKDGTFNNDHAAQIWGENEVGAHAYIKADYSAQYVEQIQGLNPKLLSCLKAIIEKDPKAMVLLQGDHGTFTSQDSNEHEAILLAVRNPLSPLDASIHAPKFLKDYVYEK